MGKRASPVRTRREICMKRLIATVTLCTAFLVLAGAAAAAPRDLPARGHGLTHDKAQARTAVWARAKTSFAPLGARLAAITISGNVYASNATPHANATVVWWVPAGSDSWYSGSTLTDTSGNWTAQTVPALSNGQIYAYPADGGILGRLGMSWSDGTGFTMNAGRLGATGVRGGPWHDFTHLTVDLFGDYAFSEGGVIAPDTKTSPVAGEFDAEYGAYSKGSVNFFTDEGVEFSGSYNVVSFTSSGSIPAANEVDAQRITVASPYWASGAPGSTIRVAMGQFPAGWVNDVTGSSEYPDTAPVTEYGPKTSSGASTEYVALKVPKNATPGYWYDIGMQHANGLGALYLQTPFQVCTMKPSKTSVRRGTKIRVTGVVPIYRHWGTTPGVAKSVTLYAHKGAAAVPTKWEPKSQGWVKVGSVKTNRQGAYTTPYFKPLKTLTLVVRYPGDDWWWGAYTSATRVAVK